MTYISYVGMWTPRTSQGLEINSSSFIISMQNHFLSESVSKLCIRLYVHTYLLQFLRCFDKHLKWFGSEHFIDHFIYIGKSRYIHNCIKRSDIGYLTIGDVRLINAFTGNRYLFFVIADRQAVLSHFFRIDRMFL